MNERLLLDPEIGANLRLLVKDGYHAFGRYITPIARYRTFRSPPISAIKRFDREHGLGLTCQQPTNQRNTPWLRSSIP